MKNKLLIIILLIILLPLNVFAGVLFDSTGQTEGSDIDQGTLGQYFYSENDGYSACSQIPSVDVDTAKFKLKTRDGAPTARLTIKSSDTIVATADADFATDGTLTEYTFTFTPPVNLRTICTGLNTTDTHTTFGDAFIKFSIDTTSGGRFGWSFADTGTDSPFLKSWLYQSITTGLDLFLKITTVDPAPPVYASTTPRTLIKQGISLLYAIFK